MLNKEELSQWMETRWDESAVPSLIEYIRIPNQSPHFDSEWEAHGFMQQAVAHIAAWCEAQAVSGFALEIIQEPGRTPLILMEIAGQTADTVLMYGHLDKQPPMEGWSPGLGPWEPVLRGEKLYGRGGADDGYAAYASLLAVKAIQEQGLPHPRILILIEASEESGSMDLPFYVARLKSRLGIPKLVVCLDSGAGNFEQLWITTSLRGNIIAKLEVDVLQEGMHSGAASGIVPDSFRIARQLLERIEHAENGQFLLPEAWVDIPEERLSQAKHCAEVLGNEYLESLTWASAHSRPKQSLAELLLNRTWRPQLTVTGADGLPPTAVAGNVLRPKTTLKLSLRIPPTGQPKLISTALKTALEKDNPAAAVVRCDIEDGSPGWNAPETAEWLATATEEASSAFFGHAATYFGEGGTIPFMGMLGAEFPKAQFLVTGVLGPKTNAHGPNEFLHIPMAKKLSCCVAYILSEMGQGKC